MDPAEVIDLFRMALETVIMMVSVIVVPGLIIGLIISVFQAATQINEQTLSFIPRLLITMLSLMTFSPWLLSQVLGFTERLMGQFGTYLN